MLNPDFRDLLSLFIDANVEFLVVGDTRWPYIASPAQLRTSIVIGRVHLILNKRTVGRPQDLLDGGSPQVV